MKLPLLITCLLLFTSTSWLTAQEEMNMKPGDKATDFKYEDENGKVYSLKDFKGKYVFIDVWASYCKACLEEVPYLKKLEKAMKGKKIVFVSISIDKIKKEWTDRLKEMELGGIHLILNYEDIAFIHDFRIDTIPRYILLDKEGKVVNVRLPYPSEPEIMKILRKLKGL